MEEVQRADGPVPQPQREGVTRGEPALPRVRGELRPGCGRFGVRQVDVGTRGAAAVTLHAGALVVLQGEEFQQMRGLVGRGDRLQGLLLVGEENSGGRHIQQGDAVRAELLEEVDQVEVVRQRIRNLHEHR